MNTPSLFTPTSPDHFIGPARKLADILTRKALACRAVGSNCKLLLIGSPGLGKTALANLFAARLAGHCSQVQSFNGRNVTVDRIREWQDSCQYRGLHGGHTVLIVNEVDTCPPASQDLLLSFLDELPAHWAFIATSNLSLGTLAERFQTRLQQFRIMPPSAEQIAEFLTAFGLAPDRALQVANGSKGNVRAALLDAQSILDCA